MNSKKQYTPGLTNNQSQYFAIATIPLPKVFIKFLPAALNKKVPLPVYGAKLCSVSG